MTVGEVKLVVDAYSENMQLEARIRKSESYNVAYLTASFVGRILGGKSIPSYSEIYPDEQIAESRNDNSLAIIKERLMDFANEANKRRR